MYTTLHTHTHIYIHNLPITPLDTHSLSLSVAQADKAGKNVTYATTEMVSPRAFVDQLAALGKA